MKWNEAILVCRGGSQWGGMEIAHMPMLEGLEYYRRVVIPQTAKNERDAFTIAFAKDWADRLAELNRSAH